MNIGTSLSALNAFTVQMDVTANNVANVNTNGFKSSSVTLENGQGQTVKAGVTANNSSYPLASNNSNGNGAGELSNVDIVNEMTQLIPTLHAYDANLKMIEANIETRGTLINMVV
jgi:flagellar basal-body rod protein FlgC